jgi:hypothetical protein
MVQINVPYTASVFQIGSSIIVNVIQVIVFFMNFAGHSGLILLGNNNDGLDLNGKISILSTAIFFQLNQLQFLFRNILFYYEGYMD